MINLVRMLLVISLSLPTYAFGHLCHDPFRPQEDLVLVPEKDLISIEDKSEFRIYVENAFPSTLRDLQLLVENEAFEIEVEPPILDRLVPGERGFFLIKLSLREGFLPGEYPLQIGVKAKSAELRPSIKELGVVIKKKIPEKQPEPLTPQEIEEELALEEREPPTEEIQPEIVEPKEEPQEAPQEERRMVVKEVPEERGEMVVKVEKIPFWKKTYFYIILILILASIFIWRKMR